MRTIVVGADGSDHSLRAVRFAADLAVDLADAELVVVFARHLFVYAPPGAAEEVMAGVLADVERSVRQSLDLLLEGRDLRWSFTTRDGEPAEVLRGVALERGASFLVVGRRGASNLRELLLGSVSNRLVHRSDCPVLLVG